MTDEFYQILITDYITTERPQPMTTKDKIAIMQAYDRGEKIESRLTDFGRMREPFMIPTHSDWAPLSNNPPFFNFAFYDYRIAPKFTPEQQRVMAAHRRGEIIQYRDLGDDRGNQKSWHDTANNSPLWVFNECEYRVKPRYTKEQQEIINAYERGEEIEVQVFGGAWIPVNQGRKELEFMFDDFEYRIKQPKFTPQQQAIIDAYNRGEDIEISSKDNRKGLGYLNGIPAIKNLGFKEVFRDFNVRIRPREPREFLLVPMELDDSSDDGYLYAMKKPSDAPHYLHTILAKEVLS